MPEIVYQCPNNKKHRQTVYVKVKQVLCGKCPKPVAMTALPPKEKS